MSLRSYIRYMRNTRRAYLVHGAMIGGVLGAAGMAISPVFITLFLSFMWLGFTYLGYWLEEEAQKDKKECSDKEEESSSLNPPPWR